MVYSIYKKNIINVFCREVKMKKRLLTVGLTLALALASCLVLFPAAAQSVKNAPVSAEETGERRLFIGGYFMPRTTEHTVRQMKEMGLDYMVVDSWSSIYKRDENGNYLYENGQNIKESPELNSEYLGYTLEIFEKYGLKAIIQFGNDTKRPESELTGLDDVTVDYTQYPAFIGFEVLDEPSIQQFDWIAKEQDKFNASKYYDDYYFYVNLLNNKAAASVTGTSDYDEYVNTYAEKILSRMKQDKRQLIYDHYPLLQDDITGKFSFSDRYFRNLEILAKKAVETDSQFEGYIQTLSYNGHRHVSKADFSLQMYAHLAYGCSGVRYFTYKTPSADGWFTEDTVSAVTDDDCITDVYYDIKEINEQVRTFDAELLSYEWKGVLTNRGSANDTSSFENLTESLSSHRGIASVDSDYQLIVGAFEKGDANAYILLNAEDPLDGCKNVVEITFADATKAKVYRNGAQSIVNLDNGLLKIRLNEGEGVFVEPMA